MNQIRMRMLDSKEGYLVFIFGSIFAGLIQGLSLGAYGPFQDSKIYYELYKIVGDLGLHGGVLVLISETAKFEPTIVLLFFVENLLFAGMLSEYGFLMVNMIILNVLVSSVMFSLMEKKYNNWWLLFFVSFTISSGYLVFSKVLYVWRSVFAFVFFMLYVKSCGLKRLVWVMLSCLTHISFLLFILLYEGVRISSQFPKRNLIVLLGAGMLGSVVFIQQFPVAFGWFSSGGDFSVIFTDGGDHSFKAWLAVLFSLFILLLINREFILENSLKALYFFCLILVLASLVSYNSYQFMNRIILPASLTVGFLPFLIESKSWRFKLARLSVVMTVIPTGRVLYMLISGTFSSD